MLLIETLSPPEEDSPYAVEGTNAHTLCEIEAARHFGLIDETTYFERRTHWEHIVPEAQQAEMEHHAKGYIELLADIMEEIPGSVLLLEQRLDTGIDSCWGTSDSVIIAPGRITIVDFKYGMGVSVGAEGNPQTRLYGVAALDTFDVLSDVDEVAMWIYQPRISDGVSSETMSAEDLRAWRDEVAKVAAIALLPGAEFAPSEGACRFCPVAGECKARMRFIVERDFGSPDLLSPQEMADALTAVSDLRRWCDQIEDRALVKVYDDRVELPGWKVVRSSGRRYITDDAAAIQTLIEAGYNAEQVARFSIKPFGELERLVGKKELGPIIGAYVGKSEGKPSLARADDKRPAIDRSGEPHGFSKIEE